MPSKDRLLRERREEYEERLVRERKSKKTLKSYNWVLDRSFDELKNKGMETNPKKVGEKEIDHLWLNFYAGEENYKRWQLSIVEGFLKFNGNHIMSELKIGWTKTSRKNVNWLSPEDAMLVKDEAEGVEKVLVHLELELGLRRIEVMRLTPDSFRGDVVHVHGKGRGGGKHRTVRYHRDTRTLVQWMLHERERMIREVIRLNPHANIPSGFLIWQSGRRIGAYKETSMDNILKKLKNRLEVEYGRPFDFSHHTLRRTGGRMMWKAGARLETIKDILGHESTDQTVVYLGINLDDQTEAMDLFAEYERSLRCPKKGTFEVKPVSVSGPNEI